MQKVLANGDLKLTDDKTGSVLVLANQLKQYLTKKK